MPGTSVRLATNLNKPSSNFASYPIDIASGVRAPQQRPTHPPFLLQEKRHRNRESDSSWILKFVVKRERKRGKRELEIKRRLGSNATSDREKNKREEGTRAKERREKQS